MTYIATRDIAYCRDASALFRSLAQPSNSLLLESADIETKKKLTCLAVLDAAAKVTCTGQRVRVLALSPAGQRLISMLQSRFADKIVSRETTEIIFEFSPSTESEERRRLLAESTADVLRALQRDDSYSSDLLPFIAGGFAYDYLATFETLPEVGEGHNKFPDYEFLVAQTVLSVDHLTQTALLESWDTDQARLLNTLDTLAAAPIAALDEPVSGQPTEVLTAIADIDDATFREQVTRLQENIGSGDIYQVVPARTFTVDCPDAFAAYRQLRETNPSPYMFYIRGEDYEIFGASPESNLKFDPATRQVELYPIAGTRPRGLYPDGTINHELDIRNELDMRTDTKELTEHTMLVDLARNDLARVAEPGTRRVADLLQVDRYSRVMHLVSRVTATLHQDFDALDAYRACMNMGTLTGAPKLRASELIRQTEEQRRGSYGGAVGYLRGDGAMDTCIVIRSAFVHRGTAAVQAGAGVVHDSIPQSEADETLHKAYAVLHAISLAHNATLEVQR
ncbi:anthranilate synthase component 1 [Corynebacterium macginleyi]|uniref:anthranilate synthase component 1 n=1 Tax=Corynebacterium macginleyi TaxID=38290 RepID=UPI000EF9B1ED|nr:anthranilate synthase component 1 [Corynebacterium macginleyi]MBK4144154.1 anthranilate synthase component 1 [Corynebacterium macginleyi]MBK4165241.1 anthranilate synthase component 1 [Corynebacterium macginleyi]QRJ60009.1 anthranilate synthase component 1 [Corynebacterium macginleyi]RMB67408.1 anthranilate synthase component 1 [Corynebacterium macginleyi]